MKQAAAWINHRLYNWNSSCLLLVQSSKWKIICKGQEPLLSRWSLPGDVGRGRAGEAQLKFEWVQYLHRQLQWLTWIGFLNHSAALGIKGPCTGAVPLTKHWAVTGEDKNFCRNPYWDSCHLIWASCHAAVKKTDFIFLRLCWLWCVFRECNRVLVAQVLRHRLSLFMQGWLGDHGT